MFRWFRPTCPCDPAAKPWVETSLQWLSRQFGYHILLERPIVLPTPEFFPDIWDGTPKAARKMFRRVCSYMGADPDLVDLKFFDDPTPGSLQALDPSLGFAAGTWSTEEDPGKKAWGRPERGFLGRPGQRGVIRLEKGSLDRPGDLVGIMAHELAHQRLLGEGRWAADRFDNELLTDLTAVFHGFGVFLANNPRKSTGKLSRWPGTKLFMPEYLSEPMFGYAMAHIAWVRDERFPAWAKHLRWAPRAVFKQGVRYLYETSDSAFKPVRLRVVKDEES
jgi:hypothetical protein